MFLKIVLLCLHFDIRNNNTCNTLNKTDKRYKKRKIQCVKKMNNCLNYIYIHGKNNLLKSQYLKITKVYFYHIRHMSQGVHGSVPTVLGYMHISFLEAMPMDQLLCERCPFSQQRGTVIERVVCHMTSYSFSLSIGHVKCSLICKCKTVTGPSTKLDGGYLPSRLPLEAHSRLKAMCEDVHS